MSIVYIPPTERKTITCKGVEFRNSHFSECGCRDCLNILQGKEKADDILSLENAKIYVFIGSDFLAEYTTAEARSKDLVLWDTLREDSSSKQIPRYAWEFEYQGKYYAILCADKPFTIETNTALYKGVVLNPERYLSEKNSTTVIVDTQRRLNVTLNGSETKRT